MFKNVKPTLALVFSICLISSMAGCGDTAGTTDDSPETTTAATVGENIATETTTTAETEAEQKETTTTMTIAETEAPEETTEEPEIPDVDISEEDKQIFNIFIEENGLSGHYDLKENVSGKFYFIPNDECIQNESVVYPNLNKSVMMLCPLDEAYSDLNEEVVDMMKGRGLSFTAFRDWTDEEKNYYETMYNYVPPCLYIEWQDDWTDKYIGDYVYVVD